MSAVQQMLRGQGSKKTQPPRALALSCQPTAWSLCTQPCGGSSPHSCWSCICGLGAETPAPSAIMLVDRLDHRICGVTSALSLQLGVRCPEVQS